MSTPRTWKILPGSCAAGSCELAAATQQLESWELGIKIYKLSNFEIL